MIPRPSALKQSPTATATASGGGRQAAGGGNARSHAIDIYL
jgi:hypothetical protein